MERSGIIGNEQTRVWMRMNRILISTILALGSLALGTAAHARPEPISPPLEAPEEDESPATGQSAPEDPDDPPPLEPPEGLDCIDDEDQSSCDPDHPGNEEGKRPGNNPPPAWYSDMAYRMYELQEDLEDMSKWSAGRAPYINYFSRWMKSVTQQYYAVGFYPQGTPREYSYGKMTRGDFNYYFYYWVRPIYFSLLYYSTQYYESHRGDPQIPYYKDMLYKVSSSYHPLVLCNYGFNGNDMGSREDLRARRAEDRAGLEE